MAKERIPFARGPNDSKRRGRRELHLCQDIPFTQRKPKSTLAVIDRRSQLGKLVLAFKRDLVAKITAKNGRPPDAVEDALIEDLCALRVDMARATKASLEATTEDERDHQKRVALSNTFRHQLNALGCGEQAELERSAAEARLLREYNSR
jgi:hypothetical protein